MTSVKWEKEAIPQEHGLDNGGGGDLHSGAIPPTENFFFGDS